jgi:hypothetical protein
MTGTFEHVKKLVEKAKKTKTKRKKQKKWNKVKQKRNKTEQKAKTNGLFFLSKLGLDFFLFFLIEVWIGFCFFSSFYFSIVLQKLPVSRVTKLGIVWLRI